LHFDRRAIGDRAILRSFVFEWRAAFGTELIYRDALDSIGFGLAQRRTAMTFVPDFPSALFASFFRLRIRFHRLFARRRRRAEEAFRGLPLPIIQLRFETAIFLG